MIPDMTDMQLKVLTGIGDGLTTKEIALKVKRSNKNVEYHRGKLMTQLNAKSLAQLVKWAIRLGLTPLCVLFVTHAAAAQSRPISLGWNDPNYPAATNGFILRYTTSLSLPTNQWTVLTYIANPVPVATNYFQFTTPTNMPPTNYFFVGSFTNSYWHLESFFSNGAATPSLPASQVVNLQVLLP